MRKFIVIGIIISFIFIFSACSKSAEYELVGTLPQITEKPTETTELVTEEEITEEVVEESSHTVEDEGTTRPVDQTKPNQTSSTKPTETKPNTTKLNSTQHTTNKPTEITTTIIPTTTEKMVEEVASAEQITSVTE